MDPRTLHQRREKFQVLDVREDDEWAAGGIAGARHIPLGELPARLDELDRNRPVVMVCLSGNAATWPPGTCVGPGWPRITCAAACSSGCAPACRSRSPTAAPAGLPEPEPSRLVPAMPYPVRHKTMICIETIETSGLRAGQRHRRRVGLTWDVTSRYNSAPGAALVELSWTGRRRIPPPSILSGGARGA